MRETVIIHTLFLYVYSNTHYFKLDTYDYGNLAYSVIANKCNLANEYVVWETTYAGRQFKRNTYNAQLILLQLDEYFS